MSFISRHFYFFCATFKKTPFDILLFLYLGQLQYFISTAKQVKKLYRKKFLYFEQTLKPSMSEYSYLFFCMKVRRHYQMALNGQFNDAVPTF